MNKPSRKPNRLANYDYSQNGKYFITICTQDRACLFWENACVGANCVRPHALPLSPNGSIVEQQIDRWNQTYPNVWIEQYVIMPNHLHLIICIDHGIHGRSQIAPTETTTDTKTATVSRMVKQFKGAVTKQIGRSIWQRSFHDHIIRTQADYDRIAAYIQNNPYTWTDDCFYAE